MFLRILLMSSVLSLAQTSLSAPSQTPSPQKIRLIIQQEDRNERFTLHLDQTPSVGQFQNVNEEVRISLSRPEANALKSLLLRLPATPPVPADCLRDFAIAEFTPPREKTHASCLHRKTAFSEPYREAVEAVSLLRLKHRNTVKN